MKFRTYSEGGDTQLFVTKDGNNVTIKQNEFVFTGFSNKIHPYYRNRMNFLVEILKSKGIILNIAEVPTVEDMTNDYYDSFEYKELLLPKQDYKPSSDGNTYILFQDTEMGRGWACLIKNQEIISQEHRDIVLDELEKGDFIRSFGIDYETMFVDSLEALKDSLKEKVRNV